MLTVADRPTAVSRTTPARVARIAALRPTARVAQPQHVLVTMAVAATPLVVTVAIGLAAVRTGNSAVGPGAVTAGLLVPCIVAALAFRWPDTLPSFMTNHVHHRWWWLAAISGALALRLASRETT